MNNDKIYTTMVIRSQAETIELLEEEIKQLKAKIDKTLKYIEIHKLVYENQYEYESRFDNNLLKLLKGEE